MLKAPMNKSLSHLDLGFYLAFDIWILDLFY